MNIRLTKNCADIDPETGLLLVSVRQQITQKGDEEPTTPRIKAEHSITKSDSIIVPGMGGFIAKQSEDMGAKVAEVEDVVTLRQYSY